MAHHLATPGDPAIDAARLHQGPNQMIGLLPRSALGIHRGAPGPPTAISRQPSDPRQVSRLFPGLGDTARYHLLHFGGVDAGALHRPIEDLGKEVSRVKTREFTLARLAPGDGGTKRFYDDTFCHGILLVMGNMRREIFEVRQSNLKHVPGPGAVSPS